MMTKASDRVVINISGTKFEIGRSSILAYPDSRLGQVLKDDKDNTELYFGRSVTAFESVLTFYQTHNLHMPPTICPKAFKDELEFWQIDYEKLDKCCLFSFIQFMDKYTTHIEFQCNENVKTDITTNVCMAIKHKIWSIIDYQERTFISKLYLGMCITMVLLSVVVLAMGSLPRFRRNLTSCESFEYLSFTDTEIPDLNTYLKEHSCDDLERLLKDDYVYLYYMFPDFYNDDYDNDLENNTTQSPDIKKRTEWLKNKFPGITFKINSFYKLEYLFVAFFTIEQIVRWCFCPSIWKYYLSVLNVMGTFILVGEYVEIAIHRSSTHFRFSPHLINCLEFVRVFRVFRFLRYCKNMAAVRVLKFSIVKNAKDLLMLLFQISMMVLFFANIIYISEDRKNIDSIPQGWWLGIITITTVGFGDLFPKSVAGKIACSACALCGILILALVTSIFVETFMSLYGVAQLETMSKRKREKRWNQYMKKNSIFPLDHTQNFKTKL